MKETITNNSGMVNSSRKIQLDGKSSLSVILLLVPITLGLELRIETWIQIFFVFCKNKNYH